MGLLRSMWFCLGVLDQMRPSVWWAVLLVTISGYVCLFAWVGCVAALLLLVALEACVLGRGLR